MSRLLAAALGMAALLAVLESAHAQARTSFADDTLRLPAAVSSGAGRIGVKAESVAADAAGKLSVTDLGSVDPSPTRVVFDPPVEVERGATTRLWLVTARVDGLPAGASQARHARLVLDGVESLARYTLTNLPLATFTWTVAAPPGPWLVWRGWTPSPAALAVVVTTGDGAATGLRIAQAQLQEAGGTAQIGVNGLRLCDAASGGTCGEFTVEARSNRTLYLRLAENSSPHGKLTGSVGLAIRERPELQTLTVSLQASSLCAKTVGVLLLAVGVAVAWWVSVGVRAQAVRLEALKPVFALRETIDGLLQILNASPAGLPAPSNLASQLNTIDASLTPEYLQRNLLLPPAIPRPWGGAADPAAGLQQHVTAAAARVGVLSIVIKEGLQRLWATLPAGPAPNQRLTDAVTRLDREGPGVASEADARTLVKVVVAAYLAPPGAAGDPDAVMVRPLTAEQLRWQITRTYALGWLAWGAVTVVVGAVALVLPNAGFGAPMDFVFCALWGLGIPTAVERVQQFGAAGVASSMGISLPK